MRNPESVGQELKILMNKVNRKAEASLPPQLRENVTEMQGRVIGFLYHCRERDIYQKDVEAAFGITRATASKTLTQMEQSGLLRRCSVPGDARLKKLELTDAALSHITNIRAGMQAFEQRLTAGFTPEEKAALLAMLRRIEKNMDD